MAGALGHSGSASIPLYCMQYWVLYAYRPNGRPACADRRGGLSGFCLAQGLVERGVSCAVYGRDPDLRRRSGYRVTMNGRRPGAPGRSPDDLYELYLESSRNTPPRRMLVVITSQCEELPAPRSWAPIAAPAPAAPNPQHEHVDLARQRQAGGAGASRSGAHPSQPTAASRTMA